MNATDNPFVGKWIYRSLLNEPDINKNFNDLEFGRATLVIKTAMFDELHGTIGGTDWSLVLHGSRGYGSPMSLRFQGKGVVGGEEWIYDYIGWLVPVWPNSNSNQQHRAIVGGAHHQAWHSACWHSRFVLRGARQLTISPKRVR